MRRTILLAALAIALLAMPALAADGTTAQRKTFAAANPCPSTGKRLVTCAGYQLVWNRPTCLAGVELTWLKITATAAAKRRTDQVARCTAHGAEYAACMAAPYTLIQMCATTRGVAPCLSGQSPNAEPTRTWRDCASIVLR